MTRRSLFALLLLCASQAYAADPPTSSTGGFLQVLFGLVVVLGLMAGLAWTLRRAGLSKAASSPGNIKVVGGVSVGTRERILVVEVADQWIVVGVAPGRVNALSTMPKQEILNMAAVAPAANKLFSTWLKQTVEKRNGQ